MKPKMRSSFLKIPILLFLTGLISSEENVPALGQCEGPDCNGKLTLKKILVDFSRSDLEYLISIKLSKSFKKLILKVVLLLKQY